jgi:hypothetical protein
MTVYRVHAEGKVVYVLYDVESDEIRGIYDDSRLHCPACGMWHWVEREIMNAVRAEIAKGKVGVKV